MHNLFNHIAGCCFLVVGPQDNVKWCYFANKEDIKRNSLKTIIDANIQAM